MMAGRKRSCSRTERSLSELPDDVVRHIFSDLDLSYQKAFHLSRLSKQFQRIVQNRPNLIFDSTLPNPNILVSTLERYHRETIPLKRFTLEVVDSRWRREEVYMRCIELAAKKCLTNLKIDMYRSFVLPQAVFQVESLVELSLRNCCIEPVGLITAWPNLKRLFINDGTYVADKEVFRSILRGCPSIEYLEVDSCQFGEDFDEDFGGLKVANLGNLKQLDFMLHEGQSLRVNATPNLKSIHCTCGSTNYDCFSIGFDNSTTYPSLQSLIVTRGELKNEFFTKFTPKFPVLERLCLNDCETPYRINLSSTSLKEIRLLDNYKELPEARFEVPNLVHFEYQSRDFIPEFTFLGTSDKWSSRIKLLEQRKMDASRFLKLNRFMAALNRSETSIAVSFVVGSKVFFDHSTVGKSPMIHISGVTDFTLDTRRSEISLSSLTALLDAFFSTCTPQETTVLVCPEIIPNHLDKDNLFRNKNWFRKVTVITAPNH